MSNEDLPSSSLADADLRRAADHWSNPRDLGRTRWWSSPQVHRHINRLVCGTAIEGAWAGFNQRLLEVAPAGGFRRAISVACGHGGKELDLIELGLVEHFDLYEISEKRVRAGREKASSLGLEDRITYRLADAFAETVPTNYDLVYWNNAIHHMMDTPAAVKWSRDRLRMGGVFAMDDFVGAKRFQWPRNQLTMMSRVREQLPERYLVDPREPEKRLPTRVRRPDEAGLIAQDPTEAADSERILPAIRQYFPNANVILTGGVIYHTALNEILANFGEDPHDIELLDQILLVDEALARRGQTQYAVAIATKEEQPSVGSRVKKRARRTLRRVR
ncbi:MAG: methyltransferase domain-containing protein [Candidatus Nanopelagicales bacterium]|nr:methyltransferase domain-containing protein [Candidatus Nanopelagicales bacterium]